MGNSATREQEVLPPQGLVSDAGAAVPAADGGGRLKRCWSEISDRVVVMVEDHKRRRTEQEHDRAKAMEQRCRKLEQTFRESEDGEDIWRKLPFHEKWSKEAVLAVLRATVGQSVPQELQEDVWKHTPRLIQQDRDIFLTRLSRKRCYSNSPVFLRHFYIPDQFVDDKEIILAAVYHFPEILAQGRVVRITAQLEGYAFIRKSPLAKELFDDERVWRALLNTYQALSPLGEKLRKSVLFVFSERIRSKPGLILHVVRRCSDESLPFRLIAGPLRDDTAFALKLLDRVDERIPENALQYFADRVRATRKVVLGYVLKRGSLLKDVDVSLRGDEWVVRTACRNCPAALLYCAPGETRTALCGNKSFVLEKIFPFQKNFLGESHPQLYRMLSDELKKDPDIIVAADLSGCLEVQDLPEELAQEGGFWANMVLRHPQFWSKIPLCCRKFPLVIQCMADPSFIGKILMVTSMEDNVLLDLCRNFPALTNNRDFWLSIILQAYPNEDREDGELEPLFNDIIGSFAPTTILRDREIMLEACSRCSSVFKVLPLELQADRQFVKVVVESRQGIYALSHISQRLFPDLVARAISRSDRVSSDLQPISMVQAIAADLWTNLEVAGAWFRKRPSEFHSKFPPQVKENREFGLMVARYCHVGIFTRATSIALRSDKSFMKDAIELNHMLYWCSQASLRFDFDLALLAIARHPFTVPFEKFTDRANTVEYAFLMRVRGEAIVKLQTNRAFVKGFLPGMLDNAPVANSECGLCKLVCDRDTSRSFKIRIAEYLGVPKGRDLRLLRNAVRNLQRDDDDAFSVLHSESSDSDDECSDTMSLSSQPSQS